MPDKTTTSDLRFSELIPNTEPQLPDHAETMQLLKAFLKIKDQTARLKVIHLAEFLVEKDDDISTIKKKDA